MILYDDFTIVIMSEILQIFLLQLILKVLHAL